MLHGRLKAVLVASLAAFILVGILAPATTLAADPPGLGRFMAAIARVESGSYTARNSSTGAYGKYQIIPSSWRAWARLYLGDANAPKTPANQEALAAAKFRAMYKWLGGSWPRVAYAWLTGSDRTTGWPSFARSYVNKVMAYYAAGHDRPVPGAPDVAGAASIVYHRFQETNAAIVYTGTWRLSSGRANAGGAIRVATTRNASAALTFTGTRITWKAPLGPKLGWARVFIDDVLVKRVTLYRSQSVALKSVFSRTWAEPAEHNIRIEVIGTRNHPGVALDEFEVIQ